MSDTNLSQASETEPRTDYKTLEQALAGLDVANNDHWTEGGLPAMAAVNADLKEPITRANLETLYPGLTRDTWQKMIGGAIPVVPSGAGVAVVEPFGGNGDHDGNGSVGGAAPAPAVVDDSVLSDDPSLSDPPEMPTAAEGDPPTTFEMSPEDRLAALELIVDAQALDIAFLRKQFGWPTKTEAGG